jgi:germination protein M
LIQGRSLKMALVAAWALAIIFLLASGLWILRELAFAPDESSSLTSFEPMPEKTRERQITLYFADEAAGALLPEKRRVELSGNIPATAVRLFDELVKGPQSAELQPTIPPGARLLNAYHLDGMLVLDFSNELQANHSGGSAGELLTVYSIVNTMAENLPGVTQVKIMLESNEIESLTGHLDLTRPLVPDTRWMRPSHAMRSYVQPNQTFGPDEIS